MTASILKTGKTMEVLVKANSDTKDRLKGEVLVKEAWKDPEHITSCEGVGETIVEVVMGNRSV